MASVGSPNNPSEQAIWERPTAMPGRLRGDDFGEPGRCRRSPAGLTSQGRFSVTQPCSTSHASMRVLNCARQSVRVSNQPPEIFRPRANPPTKNDEENPLHGQAPAHPSYQADRRRHRCGGRRRGHPLRDLLRRSRARPHGNGLRHGRGHRRLRQLHRHAGRQEGRQGRTRQGVRRQAQARLLLQHQRLLRQRPFGDRGQAPRRRPGRRQGGAEQEVQHRRHPGQPAVVGSRPHRPDRDRGRQGVQLPRRGRRGRHRVRHRHRCPRHPRGLRGPRHLRLRRRRQRR
ncbi:hypothetical protein SCALM49S_00634 [Streptomyces californicus]